MKKSSNSIKKRLLISALVPLALIGINSNSAKAEDIYAPVPTLTKLHNEDAIIPDSDPSVIYPQSAYSISTGTADDYNFTTQSYDNNGNPTTNYYKINLDLAGISPEGLTWTEVSSAGTNTIQVALPNNETKYFHYTYEAPSGYSVITSGNGIKITKNSTNIKEIYLINTGATYKNTNTVDIIKGDFIGNAPYGISSMLTTFNNSGSINNFIANFISNSSSGGNGTAVYNAGIIKNFIGDFIINSVGNGQGAALYNDRGTINNIKGDFIGNCNQTYGGAIYNNEGLLGEIQGNFIGNYNNYVSYQQSFNHAMGGAIYNNSGNIDTITGNFIGNYSKSNAGSTWSFAGGSSQLVPSYSQGGAIYNSGQINLVNSLFYDNYTDSEKGVARGGAIYNRGIINITADNDKSEFRGNYTNQQGSIDDNAIYNDGSNATVNLKAQNNGEIYMYDNIKGTIDSNIVLTGDSSGIIHLYNDVAGPNITTDTVTIDMANNDIHNYNFTSLKSDPSTKYNIDVDLTGNGSADTITTTNDSESIITLNDINIMNGDIATKDNYTIQVINTNNNYLQLAISDALANNGIILRNIVNQNVEDEVTPTVKWNDKFEKYTLNTSVVGNVTLDTTTTTNDSIKLTATDTKTTKTDNVSLGDTLALVNQLETEENRNFNFDTSNDVYNVTSDLGTSSTGTMNVNGVKSGETRSTINGNNYNMFALSNPTTLNLNNVKIQGANSVVSGTNKNAVINMNNVELKNNASGITTAGSINISGKSEFDNNGNGIEVTDENSIITLNGLDGEGYDVTFKDKLKGVSGAKLNLKAGQVEFHKSVTDLDINMDGTTANLKADNVFNGQNLTVASASNVSMINNSVGTMQLNSLTLNDNMNLGVDVDLANKSMDRISANTYNLGEHKVSVNKMNLLSDAKEVRTDIEFADEQLRNNVTTSVSEVAYSPIYKYGVKYDQDNGEFQFTRSNSGGGGGDNPQPQPSYDDLNPAIMASPVAAQLGGYAGMLDNYGNAFNHMDMYMLKPKDLRAAELNANKYAIAVGRGGTYISNETNTNGIWVRPYTSYDSVGLKHGPKVHNLSYGSFIGGDFGMHDFGNGMYGTFSPYISYQGAHQHYSGNSVYQNGGTLGFTGTLYKGNFFTGLTAGVGANVTEASTMYGNEDFPMLTSGVASKTGYNIEFKDGKFIIQPSLLVSYTFVNTFDYKNGAGVKIDTAPLHAVQISPNIRFSFNTKNHWQPYAFVGMNWNIMDSGHFKAADTTLPELSMKPYVHYGLGIQKLFSDNFTAFAQVAIRNGGRNGVGGTLGLKWILGGQPQKQEEQKPKNVL